MALPKTTLVYLACPIEEGDATDIIDQIKERIEEDGKSWYDPLRAFGQKVLDESHMERVVAINRQAIVACDELVAYVRKSNFQFGTIREIEFARSLGKEVTVVTSEAYSGKSLTDCAVYHLNNYLA